MLHIHNGDCSAGIAKESSLPGEHFAWREELIEGPTPAGLDSESWRRVRSQHLSQSYGLDRNECERGLLDQEKKLASFPDHEEVVLWFEHDLFCQLHLVYILNWFGQRDLGNTRLGLICVGDFPGKQNFRGLGELNADELASLFPRRNEVSAAQLGIAALAWEAYRSPDPTDIENLLQSDTSSMPFLKPALEAHLRRFPSTRNGLGAIETSGLELIYSEPNNFIDVFHRFGQSEPLYGLGDAQFWNALQRLTVAKQPLLTTANGDHSLNDLTGQATLTPELARRTRFEITDSGESVLRGDADFVTLNGLDHWLGGVNLSDKAKLWRWDAGNKRLTHA